MPRKDPAATREYLRQWRAANRDKVRAQGRRDNEKFVLRHPERKQASDRDYRSKNKDAINERRAIAYVNSRAEILARAKAFANTPAGKASRDRAVRNWIAKNPEKVAAHKAVFQAIKHGQLTRQPCEVCGTTRRVQAHHDDYTRPLAVNWLCQQHHMMRDGRQKYEQKGQEAA